MKLTVAVLTVAVVVVVSGFDFVLDTQKDARHWKIHGNYFYAQSIVDGGRLAPNLKSNEAPGTTKGVWYFKYSEDSDNYFQMSFNLVHQLMYQVNIRLLAHPSVAVIVKNGNKEEVAKIWSNASQWCDALLNSRKLGSQIVIGVNLTEPGTYVMIDKVILGVARNITNLDTTNLNPCLTSPPVNLTSSSHTSPAEEARGQAAHYDQVFQGVTEKPQVSKLGNQIDKAEVNVTPEPTTLEDNEDIMTQLTSNDSNVDNNNSTQTRSERNTSTTITTNTSTTLIDGVNCQCSCNCSKAL